MSKLVQVSSTNPVNFGNSQNESSSSATSLESRETDNPHIRARTIFIKEQNAWKYINVSLIRKWKILRTTNLIDLTVKINDVIVKPSEKTDTHFIFNFPELRARWFDLLGVTSAECDLLALEEACMFGQLAALSHYAQVPKQDMKGSLFTQDLTIIFVPEWKSRTRQHASMLECEEEYFISDIHNQTYSSN